MHDRVPLIVAFTPNYLVPVATTLRSVLDSSPIETTYDVLCLVSEMPDASFRHKLSLIDGGTGRLQFRYMNLEHKLKGAYVDSRYTSAANYRLVIAEELPEYKYAIYTDCDVIIRQDLGALYRDLELGDAYMAGVAEASTAWQVERYAKLGCVKGEYINSGFLVLNLEVMRRERLSERFAQFLAEAEYLEFPDQDAINVVCRGRLHYLPPKYNSIRTFLLPAYRDLFLRYYTQQDLEQVHQEGNIHYTGTKPWKGYAVYLEYWWSTYLTLPREIRLDMHINVRLRLLALCFMLPGVRTMFQAYQLKTKKQLS